MADVIHLLPENVANQIAAGEVVQRPGSVVKELVENAIDAGATQIRLIVRDAGKTLIQLIDNGCGMSETDARMCFERHATSKISTSQDLFAIHTMGFRGEAMASIAAVAQVELKTRRAIDELGTRVVIENSSVQTQEPCQTAQGTNIAVKNLFFNVPARRNFLKGDAVEMRHIIEEFQRVAMAHPDVFFSLTQNDQEILHLPAGNLRQRVVKIFGDAVNKKLVPVQEETDLVRIRGFVGKPDYVKKTRGEQFFFVNNRFIKSNYLHHAVLGAYEDILPSDAHPLYVLFLDLNPAHIDINVHPTKQEIKFDDEKLVYNVLKVSIKHALGSNNVTPTLDFEQEPAFQIRPTDVAFPPLRGHEETVRNTPMTKSDSRTASPRLGDSRHNDNLRNWQRLYEGLELSSPAETPVDESADEQNTVVISNVEQWLAVTSGNAPANNDSVAPQPPSPESAETPWQEEMTLDDSGSSFSKIAKQPSQIHNQYVLNQIKSGFILVDQQYASERILYERYLNALRAQPIATQAVLFPRTFELPTADAVLLREMLADVNLLGFDINEFGGNTFVIHGVPAELTGSSIDEVAVIERLVAQFRENLATNVGIHENLARSLAKNAALKRGKALNEVEMQDLINQLFACEIPYKTPFGKNCFITLSLDELKLKF